QAAMANHKKLRALFLEHFDAIAIWGRQSGRISCVRQAGKMRPYTIRVSDLWLEAVAALPLGRVEDRLVAAPYVAQGGGHDTFGVDPEPSDPEAGKFSVGM